MFKQLKQRYENAVQRWLFKEEIEQHERMMEDPQTCKQTQTPSEEEVKAEAERIKSVHEEQLALIKAEDHSQAPSENDIKRYHQYHVNMVENIHVIEKHTGEKAPFPVPENPLTEDEYRVMVQKDGWRGMRISCGLPTGDLNKPRQPWVAPVEPKKWTTDEPEIHWKKD